MSFLVSQMLSVCQRLSGSAGSRVLAQTQGPNAFSLLQGRNALFGLSSPLRFYSKKSSPPLFLSSSASSSASQSPETLSESAQAILNSLTPQQLTVEEEVFNSFSLFLGSNSQQPSEDSFVSASLFDKVGPSSQSSKEALKAQFNPLQEFFQFQNRFNIPLEKTSELTVYGDQTITPPTRFYEIPSSPSFHTHLSLLPAMRYLELTQMASEANSNNIDGRSTPVLPTSETQERSPVYEMSSVMKKRRRKMNKHKYRKTLKAQRYLRRAQGRA
eukprot:TRINITY_DN3214_c0_g1_i1.p1 TRINITY_DN3214_c0_g1~~TRINITY_DN3214_c0_g1_i1.p1  ORF type:complete len:272 (+),score=115.89 TRINITY_DN3214_c0_g1_i1:146-961(+)